jgi:hypothetical protein
MEATAMTMVVMCEGTDSSLLLPSTAMLAHGAAFGDTAVAVESESVSAMDFADDLPQLSRLQHAEEGAGSATKHTPCATVTPTKVVAPSAQHAAGESSERTEQTAYIEQQREQQPRPQQREQCGMEAAAVGAEQFSAPSTTREPPPPAALTQQVLQSHTPPAADITTAATNTATSGPCAYVVPLISHLDNYTASQAAIVDRYKAALLEFDQVAVSGWLLAATRHLKQQEETKRDMTESGQQLRQEIADFAQKMMQWRGGSADKIARQRPRQ